MAKIKYVGVGKNPPERTVVFGHKFERGQTVTVTDEHAIMKLTHNPSFEVIGEPKAWPAKPEEVIDVEEVIEEALEEVADEIEDIIDEAVAEVVEEIKDEVVDFPKKKKKKTPKKKSTKKKK